jgi:tetratricopeptide (TPR) repeat protein
MTQTDTNLTMTGDILGTLRYMSPEQVQAKHGVLDHRTDVYSLGLTLYELLTLQPAFPGNDRQKLIRQIIEDDPRPPRQLNKAIPRDLETIVLKATAKEPDSRYATAEELAGDLGRFLHDKPIRARRPSLADRGSKWLRRHPSVFFSALLLLVVVVVGLTVGVTLVTREQRKTAAALQDKQAALSTAEGNLRLAAEAVEQMLTRTSQDAVFHGHVEHAEIQMGDAVAMFQTLLRRSHDPMLRYRAARAYNTAGEIQRLLGRYEESRNTHQQAVAVLSELADEFPEQPVYQAGLASSHNRLGMALYYLSQMQEAERSLKAAVVIRERLAARFPDRPEFQMDLADSLGNLGQVYREMDRLDEAERTCRRVLSILDGLPRECRLGPEGLSRSGAATGNLALVLRDRGKLDEAKQWLEKAFWDNLLARNHAPDNPSYCEGLYNACWNFADLALRQGDHALAASQVEQMIKFFPQRLQTYSESVALLVRCAELAAKDAAEADKAEAYNRRAGELLKQSAQAADRHSYSANDLAWLLATWPDETFRDAPRAVALAESAVDAMPEKGNHWNTLGVARYRAGKWKAAVEALKKSMELRSGGDSLDRFFLAMAYWQLGKKEEARQWYDKAVVWMDENKPDDEELRHFRREAAELLGPTGGKSE